MTIEKAHQVLEKAGFDAVARDCLERRKQLFDIALFVEKEGDGLSDKIELNTLAKENWNSKLKSLGYWNYKIELNTLAKENQLMEFVARIGNLVQFTGRYHQILEEIGFSEEARNCLEVGGQISNIAEIVERYRVNLTGDKAVLNKLANKLAVENRIEELIAVAVNNRWLAELDITTVDNFLQSNPKLTTEAIGKLVELGKTYLLKEIGFNKDARNCLEVNGQISNIAEIVERYRVNLTGDKAVLNKLANKLAVENRIEELIAVAVNNRWLAELDITTVDNFLQSNPKLTTEAIGKLVEVGKAYQIITAFRVNPESTVAEVYKEYLSDLRTVTFKKKNSRTRKRRKRKKIGRYVRCKRKLSALSNLALKGKYIGELLSQCEYLLTHAQLGPMIKKFKLTATNIAELCELGVIYRQEQDNTFLYAESENKFKQNWGSQIEYFNDLFNRSGFTKTKRLISYLVESALLEKGWRLDEIYVSILISKVLQIPANAYVNITEKKRKDKLVPKNNIC